MDQASSPPAAMHPDIEANGNWMQQVKLKIDEEAKHVSYLPRFDDQIDSKKQWPSIFRPRRQVAARMPVIAQTTLSQQRASSRGSTGGNVIVAAVGPYHPDDQQPSESPPPLITRAKKCAIVEFLARPEFGLDTAAFLEWAFGEDARARGYYEADSFKMRRKELAEMHLLDGCLVLFAVFLLRKSSVRGGEDHMQPCPSCLAEDLSVSVSTRTRCVTKRKIAQDFINLSADISQHMKQTRLDLLLLGNQIPFFVLDHLHLHTKLKGTLFEKIERSTQDLALSCFDDIRPCPSGFVAGAVSFPKTVHHLLHLFHWSRVPPGPGKKNAGEAVSFTETVHHLLRRFHWSRVPPGPGPGKKNAVDDGSPPLLGEPESNLPCATWFEESRIGFRTHAAAPATLHMAFRRSLLGARGVLCVPALHIHDYSALVFRNLIAFEQNHLRCGFGATTYCICMAGLLQSEADAKLLRRSGVLAHTHETDEEIVALFRGLADEYRHASYSRDLLDLCRDVDVHHHSTAARAVKSVVRQCFPRQTVTFFVILGALISIATLINTIVSVYRFYHPVINQY